MISSSSIFASPPVSRRRCYQWFRSPRDKPFILVSLGRPSTSKLTLALLSCNSSSPKQIAHAVQRPSASNLAEEDNDDEEGFQVVTAVRTNYNDIVIIDTRDSRMLLLDSSHNVHSIFNKGEKWTGAYWDEFASLPAVVPQGPIAILGLGGGTAAHLMLDLWPSLQLEGWEIDEILIYKAREYLGLSDLEKHTSVGGILCVHIGDAFSPLVNIPGGYAGIVIDLFSNGKVLPQLEEVATWLELSEKLMPHGRLMVNCGAANEGTSVADGTWIQNSTIKALCQAFPGQANWKKLTKAEGENFLALTGPLPDLTAWSAVLPDRLSSAVKQWAPCLPFGMLNTSVWGDSKLLKDVSGATIILMVLKNVLLTYTALTL